MQINAVIRLKLCYKTDNIQYYQIKKKKTKNKKNYTAHQTNGN